MLTQIVSLFFGGGGGVRKTTYVSKFQKLELCFLLIVMIAQIRNWSSDLLQRNIQVGGEYQKYDMEGFRNGLRSS